MIVWAVIAFLAVLIWDLITDYKTWLGGRTVDHNGGAWLRSVLLVPTVIFLIWGNYWWVVFPAALMTFAVWWLLFDGLYSLMIGQRFWYVGSGSWLDRMQADWPVWFRAVGKLTLAAGSVYLYIRLI